MEQLTKAQLVSLLTPAQKEDILQRIRFRYRVVTTLNGSLKLQTIWRTEQEAEEAKAKQLEYWIAYGSVSSYVSREVDI